MDFHYDVTTDGRPINIVSITELDDLATQRCTYPAVLRCDNGPELACNAMADLAHHNGSVESFNARIRDECLINSF